MLYDASATSLAKEDDSVFLGKLEDSEMCPSKYKLLTLLNFI